MGQTISQSTRKIIRRHCVSCNATLKQRPQSWCTQKPDHEKAAR
jgi:hypothetical protein